jgi:predicted nucleic acid-binding protein
MNILLDSNIALDVILQRKPFYQNAKRVVESSQHGLSTFFISASAVTVF